MSFITKQDLTSHIYEENIDVITRDDDSKVDTAINTAIRQAAGYLARYDTATIFAATGTDREIYADLITYIKDIAKWHLIAICNAAVDLDLADSRYKAAVSELGKIQTGKVTPPGWPPAVSVQNQTPMRSGSRSKFSHS